MLDVTSREDGKAGLRVRIRITKVKERCFLWFKRKPITSRKILIADNWHSKTGHFHFNKWDYPETRGAMSYDDGYCYLVTMPTEKFPFYPIKRDRIRQLIDEWFDKKGIELDGEWKD